MILKLETRVFIPWATYVGENKWSKSKTTPKAIEGAYKNNPRKFVLLGPTEISTW
jgi:hypothetical protein